MKSSVPALPPPSPRLPWIISEENFTSLCTKCGNCLSACEEKIISRDFDGFPAIDFEKGECTFCEKCIDACVEPLFKNAKLNSPWTATLSISKKCLAKKQIYCQSCRDGCEQNAIQFKYLSSPIPTPVVDNSLCNGCGSCISNCPSSSTELDIQYV